MGYFRAGLERGRCDERGQGGRERTRGNEPSWKRRKEEGEGENGHTENAVMRRRAGMLAFAPCRSQS